MRLSSLERLLINMIDMNKYAAQQHDQRSMNISYRNIQTLINKQKYIYTREEK